MTVFVLEMRSTANWDDVRYRDYTTSARKAELFKSVPKIQFTDSGHGIVPSVKEHAGRRLPKNRTLADHVNEAMAGYPRQRSIIRPRQAEVERLRAALTSIANNTCCDGCQEAAKWARAALNIQQRAGEQ